MTARLSLISDGVNIDTWGVRFSGKHDPESRDGRGDEARTAAAKALKYSRGGDIRPYDDVGFQLFAATPHRGAVTLSTLSEMRQTRGLEEVHQKSSALEGIVA